MCRAWRILKIWSILNHFLSRSILVYLDLSWFILVYLGSSLIMIYFDVSWSISGYLELSGPFWTKMWYLGLSQAISVYLNISGAILGYLELSWALSEYNELSLAFAAISGCIWLSLAISIKYQVSGCKKKQERAINCNFKTFWLFFFTRASSRGARAPKKEYGQLMQSNSKIKPNHCKLIKV